MTRPRSRTFWRAALIPLLVVAACSPGASSIRPSAPAATTPAGSATTATTVDDAAARQYCTDQGGMLVDRVATWNTNADPSQWVELAGRMTLCEFEMGQGDQATRIAVDLVTLSSEEPTLAAVAYLSKPTAKLPPNPGANPAEYNCREGLGGSGSFGSGASGGGWVDQDQPVFVVMDLCMFEDGSAIDEFGLLYHADGTIRGADLATKFRYQAGDQLPAIFPPGS